MYRKFGKRLFDIVASLIGLILLAPLFLIIALLIKLTSKGPILFVQRRVGENFKEFNLYKFRSMREGKGLLITSKDDPRITEIGKFIRKTKIDELPQLFNVLKGDMSLVGPRPEVKKYVNLKRDEYQEILKVKPGITDFAAIRYRNEEEELANYKDKERAYIEKIMPKKIKFYKEYIEKISFLTDIEIILETLKIRLFNFDIFSPNNKKRTFVYIFADLIFTLVAIYIAFLLRFDFQIPQEYYSSIFIAWGFLFSIRFLLFYLFGIYQVAWRYFSFRDTIKLIYLMTLSTAIFILLIFSYRDTIFHGFPRSVVAIEFFISLAIFLLFRMSKRTVIEIFKSKKAKEGIPALIVATPSKAEEITRSLLNSKKYRPIAIWSDQFKGIKINGVDVLDLDKIKRSYGNIKVAIVSDEYSINDIFDQLKVLGVEKIKKFVVFESCKETIKDITISDLLARNPKDLDKELIENFIRGKVVLITGAGGSIGSELVRQVIEFKADRVILLDHSEFNLYTIEQEILPDGSSAIDSQKVGKGGVKFNSVMQTVIKEELLEETFKRYKPNIVLHTAAYKHVPMCEANKRETVLNNIFGTKNVIDLSIKYGVEKFVLISTDKAVRPTSVMGATKRVCELYAQNVNSGKTEIVSVRFGNVLGSSGSVIPKFRQQIEKGEAVTVTHPEVTRYFMLISEACQLVLQAGAIGKGGEIFILDMGEPIKILDLAKRMIALSGKRDIEIKFTGLREGEKLYEELLINESDAKTEYESILVAKPTPYNIDKLNKQIEELLNSDDIVRKLREIIPEFSHQSLKT